MLHNIQTIFSILLSPKSSCSKPRPPSISPRARFMAKVADEFTKMTTGFCVWGVKPIIIPIDCFSKIESLTIGPKTPIPVLEVLARVIVLQKKYGESVRPFQIR